MRVTMALGIGLAMLSTACLDKIETPIGVAAANNDAAEIRALVRSGAKADEIGPNGVTPLMIAARQGALDAMDALFEAGADPNRRDRRFDWTPLMHAVHKGQAKAAEALLKRGADPNAGTEGGLTPLMMAAGDSDPRIVELLLAQGANPRTSGEYGDTPRSCRSTRRLPAAGRNKREEINELRLRHDMEWILRARMYVPFCECSNVKRIPLSAGIEWIAELDVESTRDDSATRTVS
jgi:uncharacterized protein